MAVEQLGRNPSPPPKNPESAKRSHLTLSMMGEIFVGKKSASWKNLIEKGLDVVFPHLQAVPLKESFYHPRNPIVGKITDAMSIWGAPDIKISGKENVEEAIGITDGKNLVFVMRHLSNFDTAAVQLALKRIGFGKIVSKLIFLQGIKLDKNPVTKVFQKAFNRIKVWPPSLPAKSEEEKIKRKKMMKESLESSKKALKEGHVLGIYCEGGRSYDALLKPVEPAAIHYLTLQPNTIVIPVTIRGTNRVLPPGAWLIFPAAPVKIDFGEPINITTLMKECEKLPHHREKYKKVGDFIMKKIAKKLPEHLRGAYSDKS